MQRKRVLILVLVWVTALSLFAADYVFESYHLDVDVSASNVYAIKENIVANFSTPRHGIFREIPVRFGKTRVKLENLSSSDPIIEDSVSKDYITFRLGSADSTVIGRKPYTLSYTYDIGEDGYSDYDELYFNLVGPGWQSTIEEFTFAINFPKPIDESMIWLTGGTYGSTDQRGTFKLSADKRTLKGKAENLAPGEALTLRVQMEQGYFTGMTVHRDYTVVASILAVLLGIAASIFATMLFRRYGREELFVPVVRFDPPEGFSPLEVGFIADGRVDNKDLTSLIFYWADQGCLSIEEESKKKITFTRIQDPTTDKKHERNLFNAFFTAGDGITVTLKDLEKQKFGQAMEKAKAQTLEYFKGERRLSDPMAEKKRVIIFLMAAAVVVANALAASISYLAGGTVALLVVGLFSTVMSGIIAYRLTSNWEMRGKFSKFIKMGAFVLVSLFAYVAAVIILYGVLDNGGAFSMLMAIAVVFFPAYLAFLGVVTAKRSSYAHKMLEQTIGYRDFISKVEVDKLKMMIDDDPELFYHVLGYATVLGLEDKWAKKFATIALNPPTWYYGQNLAFNALFYSSLSRRIHSNVMEHAIYSQAKSGASGGVRSSFGGSGFSGGGFGGGGGGAW
ncbi:MAG: DUF2207 domain-containing protein [Spirochaetia bacterium]|nr:DUF2207 domain-containing protein [Spirochaetia bacterium]